MRAWDPWEEPGGSMSLTSIGCHRIVSRDELSVCVRSAELLLIHGSGRAPYRSFSRGSRRVWESLRDVLG